MSVLKLKDKILPAVFNNRGYSLVDCQFDSASVGQDQFMSSVVFLTAVLESGGKKVKIPLVVKYEPTTEKLREYLKTTVQFYNEVFMYSEVLPVLEKNKVCEDTFAKFYYGVGKLGDPENENIVIVEDLRPLGFKLTEGRGFISFQHLSLAMSKLGRFHALSYAAKKHTDGFFKLVENLKEPSWVDSNSYLSIVKACFHRPAEHLIGQGKHVDVLQRLLKSFDLNIIQFMKKLVACEEPIAVVCHGDFCRNNILFKYDPETGAPTDVKFFDIATSRYSSPVVDISFFLFLNSSRKTRKDHWDELLAIYHHSLSSTIPGLEVPSLEALKKEVLRKALYGFVHCAFFLPAMLYEHPYGSLDIVMNTPSDVIAREYALIGGEEGTELLADMVEELIERGCLTLEHEFMV